MSSSVRARCLPCLEFGQRYPVCDCPCNRPSPSPGTTAAAPAGARTRRHAVAGWPLPHYERASGSFRGSGRQPYGLWFATQASAGSAVAARMLARQRGRPRPTSWPPLARESTCQRDRARHRKAAVPGSDGGRFYVVDHRRCGTSQLNHSGRVGGADLVAPSVRRQLSGRGHRGCWSRVCNIRTRG